MKLDGLDLRRLDPDEMHLRISELPDQILQAWGLVAELSLPKAYRDFRNVAVLGMGGSAIGADLARSLLEHSSPVPIQVVRDYRCPAYVGPDSLVIASSYSGNTEETLAALEEALAAGAHCVAVGTGGRLEQRALAAGLPYVPFHYRSSPRAAIGFSFALIAGVLRAAGLSAFSLDDLRDAADVMRAWQAELSPDVPTETNAAKQMALRLHGRVPIVYGAGILSEVARRWKGQVNENSKAWAFFEVMPELDHNAVLGYSNPGPDEQKQTVIMLRSKLDHPRVQVRYDVTATLLEQNGVPCEMVWARGDTAVAQMLSSIHFGDYVSLYLAYLYESDPTPVGSIDYLKAQLAQA